MNSSIQMRGYVLTSAVSYLANKGERGKDAIAKLSPETQQTIASVKAATWCNADRVAEVYRAIAALGDGNEDRARTDLIDCGKWTAREASNTFLRLIMKLLTPTLFAKKLPQLWMRDCTGGKIEVELTDNRIRNRLTDMGGFDHIAPVAAGYVAFALETMGKTITKSEVQGWSLATPGPSTASFELQWKV